jgi:metal-sulfur cluster biosynthetic enzyme
MTSEDTASVSEEDVYEALEEVIDPELGLDFVSLGLVYDVETQGSDVYVTFTLTYPGCPIGPQVSEQVKEFVGELEGVERVHPKMVFDPHDVRRRQVRARVLSRAASPSPGTMAAPTFGRFVVR